MVKNDSIYIAIYLYIQFCFSLTPQAHGLWQIFFKPILHMICKGERMMMKGWNIADNHLNLNKGRERESVLDTLHLQI